MLMPGPTLKVLISVVGGTAPVLAVDSTHRGSDGEAGSEPLV